MQRAYYLTYQTTWGVVKYSESRKLFYDERTHKLAIREFIIQVSSVFT